MNALGTFRIKPSTFKKRVRKVRSEVKGFRSEEKKEISWERGRK